MKIWPGRHFMEDMARMSLAGRYKKEDTSRKIWPGSYFHEDVARKTLP